MRPAAGVHPTENLCRHWPHPARDLEAIPVSLEQTVEHTGRTQQLSLQHAGSPHQPAAPPLSHSPAKTHRAEAAPRAVQSTDWPRDTAGNPQIKHSLLWVLWHFPAHREGKSSRVFPFKLKDGKSENSFLCHLQAFLLLNALATARTRAETLTGKQALLNLMCHLPLEDQQGFAETDFSFPLPQPQRFSTWKTTVKPRSGRKCLKKLHFLCQKCLQHSSQPLPFPSETNRQKMPHSSSGNNLTSKVLSTCWQTPIRSFSPFRNGSTAGRDPSGKETR